MCGNPILAVPVLALAMLDTLHSLSLASGTLVVAFFPVTRALVFGKMRTAIRRWPALLIAPFLLADASLPSAHTGTEGFLGQLRRLVLACKSTLCLTRLRLRSTSGVVLTDGGVRIRGPDRHQLRSMSCGH